MFRDYDGNIEWVPSLVIGGIFLAIGLVIVGAVLDLGGDFRSFDAKVACEAKQMQPRRRPFTTQVTCVPAIQRQDTTTLKINR